MSDADPDGPTDDELSFEGFDHVVALLADVTDEDRHRIEPPPSVWNAIVDTVSADRNGRPDRALTFTDDGNGSVVADITSIEQQATTTISLARSRPAEHPVLPPEMSSWRRQWLPVAAAVAVAIVGGLVTWAFSDELPGGRTAADGAGSTVELGGEVVAVAPITDAGPGNATDEPTGGDAVGEARLVKSGDRYYLDLDLPDLPQVDGYIELWIADPTNEALFSLGVVTGDGRYALPGNLDPAEYPVVDVSVESIDGDPTHSGQRLWWGVLDL